MARETAYYSDASDTRIPDDQVVIVRVLTRGGKRDYHVTIEEAETLTERNFPHAAPVRRRGRRPAALVS